MPQGKTCVTEPAPTRDHTERMLAGMGYPVTRDGARVCLEGGHSLHAIDIDVPADISSAAFFLVGASIAPGSDLVLEHVGMNPTRTGVIDILQRMGASIEVGNARDVGGEPVADLRVRAAQLQGIDIPPELVPLAIDEFPVIFVAAACASGRTVLTGAEELRVKESDRIQVMADGLQALGVQCRADTGWHDHRGWPDRRRSGRTVTAITASRWPSPWRHCVHRVRSRSMIAPTSTPRFPDFVGLAGRAGLAITRHD